MDVAVIQTGVANTASVLAGIAAVGGNPRLVDKADEIKSAGAVVLPGVGAFAAGMGSLAELGLIDILRERIAANRSTLCVCLGMQLLADNSEESPGTKGLGVLGTNVVRFRGQVRIPQLGWNSVEPESGCEFLQKGCAYYANSFHLEGQPNGWKAAWTEHGVRFVGAIERGAVLGCQFHPELSGPWGRTLLKRWLERARG